METLYQRGRIQEESLLYESQKHSGELPIVGVNTFENPSPARRRAAARAAALERRREARAARRTCAPSRRATPSARPRRCARLQDVRARGRQRVRGADGDGEGREPRPDQRRAVRGRRALPALDVRRAALLQPPRGYGLAPSAATGDERMSEARRRRTSRRWRALAREELRGARPRDARARRRPTACASSRSTPRRISRASRDADTLPGLVPVPARPARHHVREPAVDDPPVRRLLDRRGVERLLPREPRGGPAGPLGRLRPRHPPRLRLGPPARARRRRQGRRRDRLRRGHEDPVRRHPARPGHACR